LIQDNDQARIYKMNLEEDKKWIIEELKCIQNPLTIGVIKLMLENRGQLSKDPLLSRKVALIQYVMYCDDVSILEQLEDILKGK